MALSNKVKDLILGIMGGEPSNQQEVINGLEGGANAPSWTKYTVTFTNLRNGTITNAGATSTITVASIPQKSVIMGQIVNVSIAFSGGAITSTAGHDGTNNPDYDNYVNVDFTNQTTFPLNVGTFSNQLSNISGSTDFKLQITVDTVISDLTAGVADIYILTSNLP